MPTLCKIIHNLPSEIIWQGNGYEIKQKKNKYGVLTGVFSLYTQNGGAGDYYDTTAFSVFYAGFIMKRVLDIELEEE